MEPQEPTRPAFTPAPRPRPRRKAFGVGDIFSRTFGVWFSRLPAFLLLTALLFLPLFGYLFVVLGDPAFLMDEEDVLREGGRSALARAALQTAVLDVLGTVLGSLAAAAFAYTVMKRLQRQPASFGACVAMGFSRLPAVLGVALVVGLVAGAVKVPPSFLAPGSAAAALPFTIASLVVSIIWSTAVPAAVVERLGVAAALGRSAALTSGYRWQIFWAWFLLGLVVGTVVTVVLMALLGAFASGAEASQQQVVRLGVIIGGVLAAVVGSLQAVGSTVVYHGLRDAKEGMSADDLVKAFE